MKYKLLKLIKTIYYILLLVVGSIIKIIPFYKNIWIIAERGNDARDNAYHLFKYINSLEAPPKIYYIIDKNSTDYSRVRDYSNLIMRGTFKHWLYFSLSKVKISTHIMGYAPDIYLFMWLDKYNLVFGKKVFIQHGIIYNDLPGLYYPSVKLDLFVCGAKLEYEFVKNNFNHPENVVQYLGLCRYDNLLNYKTERVILLMPTWRSWLNDCKSDAEFKSTEYYKRYNQLLNSRTIIDALKEYNYKLIFYPHYEMQKYAHCFEPIDERIIIAEMDQYDVQYLLKVSNLLITDYSSVYFDFVYMKKPVIFYTFDIEEFYSKHYKLGYLDFLSHPFGKAYSNEDKIINSICRILVDNFSLSQDIDIEIDKFFILKDTDNCKRNYNAIMSLLG